MVKGEKENVVDEVPISITMPVNENATTNEGVSECESNENDFDETYKPGPKLFYTSDNDVELDNNMSKKGRSKGVRRLRRKDEPHLEDDKVNETFVVDDSVLTINSVDLEPNTKTFARNVVSC